MTTFSKFLRDESGAITIDWVALTAGILLLGIVLVYAIFNNGVSSLGSTMNSQLSNMGATATLPTTPITTVVLNTLLPTTFPRLMSDWLRKAPERPAASSGRDVPTATTVRPITRSLTPSIAAPVDAPSTTSFAPIAIIALPTSTSRTWPPR